jgi:MoxR-like ATPase
MEHFDDIGQLEEALLRASYLPDRGLATALFLALRVRKPLLLEGEAGVGKTEAAKAISSTLGARLIRLQCYEGLDVAHAVYEWNYTRQLLHIRATQDGGPVAEDELFGPKFLIRRPLLEAISSSDPVVLLIDEIDRADDEFEAFLLELLSDFQITIPEIGTITAQQRPVVILTSNRTRELHDALKRRCLFHWIGHPSCEREVEIVRLRVPGVPERLASQAVTFVQGRARRRAGGVDARVGAQVPRGPRVGARRDAAQPPRGGPSWRGPSWTLTRSSARSSHSGGCSGRWGSRSARGGSPTR